MASIVEGIETWLNDAMPWMYWKGEVVIFLICFFLFLTTLAIYSVKKPSNPRSGFLRIPTTLGDRIFISVVILIATLLTIQALDLPLYLLTVAILIMVLILYRG